VIYALDLSLRATGWAISEGDGPVQFGTFPKSKWDHDQRRGEIAAHVFSKIPESCVDPLILIENFAFGAVNKAHDIGMLHGVIRYGLYRRGFFYLLVAPGQVKKFATGKGNSDKNLVIRAVFQRFGIEADDDNAADAVTLLHIGKAISGLWEPTMDAQREVVAQLKKENPWLKKDAF
jgi:crossover junction endodeoxyribonuclease RuvC